LAVWDVETLYTQAFGYVNNTPWTQKISPAGTNIFVYDGGNVVEETNAAGAVVAL